MTEPITPQQDHDRRIGRLEGIAEQLDRRLDSIEKRIDSLERRVDGVERAIADLARRMDSQFRWMVGIQITTLIALCTLILTSLP